MLNIDVHQIKSITIEPIQHKNTDGRKWYVRHLTIETAYEEHDITLFSDRKDALKVRESKS